jgi:hypothetical protein
LLGFSAAAPHITDAYGANVVAMIGIISDTPERVEKPFFPNPENKPQVVKSLARGLRLKRLEDAEEGYQSVAGIYERKIYPSVDGIRNVIRLLSASNEKVRRLKAEELVDDSVVRRLEKEGGF